LRTSNFAIDADGGLLTAEQHGVMKIGTDGYVQRLAGSPLICEGMGSRGIRGFADGPADVRASIMTVTAVVILS
jgi:hypothetical protein